MAMDGASVVLDERGATLRIVRRVNKAETELAAKYCRIASTDKLIEALAFPMVTCENHRVIEEELERRLELVLPVTRAS